MQVTLLDKSRIAAEWPDIASALAPALSVDPDYDVEDLRNRAVSGSALVFEVSGEAEGLWVVSIREHDEKLVAWTTAIVGKLSGGPRQRVQTLRAAVAALEATFRHAGVTAHRICGRDWSRIFPDYGPFDGDRFGIEKRLI